MNELDNIDATKVGQAAANMMEMLAENYGKEAVIQQAMVIVQVKHPKDDDEDKLVDTIEFTSTANSLVYDYGMLGIAFDEAKSGWSNDFGDE